MSENVEKSGFKIEASSLRAYTMLGALILIWLFFHWLTGGKFLSSGNLSNLMLQTSVTGILAVGMLMVIVSGNIDLSIGSVLALAGGVAAIALVPAMIEYRPFDSCDHARRHRTKRRALWLCRRIP